MNFVKKQELSKQTDALANITLRPQILYWGQFKCKANDNLLCTRNKKFVRIQSIVSKGARKQKLAFLADLSAKVLPPPSCC